MNTVNDLYNLITNAPRNTNVDKAAPESIYGEIMAKEDKAIRLMNRVMDDKARAREIATTFADTRLSMIPSNLLKNINDIINDLLRLERITPFQIIHIFAKDHRPIYLGILFLLVGLYMTFIHLADHD